MRSFRSIDPAPREALDIYRPNTATPRKPTPDGAPVVVFFYGGSWTSGNRAMYRFVGEALAARGIALDPVNTSFFIGHNNIVSGPEPLLPNWQRRLFFALGRLAASPSEFLGLPADRTVELGSRIEV